MDLVLLVMGADKGGFRLQVDWLVRQLTEIVAKRFQFSCLTRSMHSTVGSPGSGPAPRERYFEVLVRHQAANQLRVS